MLLLLLAGGAIPACTFERRAEAADEDFVLNSSLDAEQTSSLGEPSATVRLFREAVATGDLSLALALLDRNATLIDGLVGHASEVVTRGEFLLDLRRRHAAGLMIEVIETQTMFPAEDAVLVLSLLAVLEEGEDGILDEVTRLHESVLLVRTVEGWRIRHLHRSGTEVLDLTPDS